MPFTILVVIASAIWLISLAVALLALRWSLVPGARRFRAALISSCVTLAIGWLGLTRIHLTASKTVNDQVVWSLNSKWFFIVSLLLGAVSLAVTFWNRRKASLNLETRAPQ
jgi:hypothetical protein